MQHKSMSNGEGVRLKKISLNIFCFAIEYQEITDFIIICLLQPKTVGRNYLYTNNRYIILIRFITLNNTVHHFCKNLYYEKK